MRAPGCSGIRPAGIRGRWRTSGGVASRTRGVHGRAINHPSARAPVGDTIPVIWDASNGGTARNTASTNRPGRYRAIGNLFANCDTYNGCRTNPNRPTAAALIRSPRGQRLDPGTEPGPQHPRDVLLRTKVLAPP